jgi:hypothetical protein
MHVSPGSDGEVAGAAEASCCLGGVLAISTSLSLRLRSGVSAITTNVRQGNNDGRKPEAEPKGGARTDRSSPCAAAAAEAEQDEGADEPKGGARTVVSVLYVCANCGGVVGFWGKGRTGEAK